MGFAADLKGFVSGFKTGVEIGNSMEASSLKREELEERRKDREERRSASDPNSMTPEQRAEYERTRGNRPGIATSDGSGGPSTTGSTGKGGTFGDRELDAAAKSIRTIESGSADGNYNALGVRTKSGDRAYGAYQVMGANVPAWTKTHYGQQLTPDEFLKNREAQDAVFKGEFGGYMQKYGPEGASRAWFGGPGAVAASASGRQDANKTSVGGYGSRFGKLYATHMGDAPTITAGRSDADTKTDRSASGSTTSTAEGKPSSVAPAKGIAPGDTSATGQGPGDAQAILDNPLSTEPMKEQARRTLGTNAPAKTAAIATPVTGAIPAPAVGAGAPVPTQLATLDPSLLPPEEDETMAPVSFARRGGAIPAPAQLLAKGGPVKKAAPKKKAPVKTSRIPSKPASNERLTLGSAQNADAMDLYDWQDENTRRRAAGEAELAAPTTGFRERPTYIQAQNADPRHAAGSISGYGRLYDDPTTSGGRQTAVYGNAYTPGKVTLPGGGTTTEEALTAQWKKDYDEYQNELETNRRNAIARTLQGQGRATGETIGAPKFINGMWTNDPAVLAGLKPGSPEAMEYDRVRGFGPNSKQGDRATGGPGAARRGAIPDDVGTYHATGSQGRMWNSSTMGAGQTAGAWGDTAAPTMDRYGGATGQQGGTPTGGSWANMGGSPGGGAPGGGGGQQGGGQMGGPGTPGRHDVNMRMPAPPMIVSDQWNFQGGTSLPTAHLPVNTGQVWRTPATFWDNPNQQGSFHEEGGTVPTPGAIPDGWHYVRGGRVRGYFSGGHVDVPDESDYEPLPMEHPAEKRFRERWERTLTPETPSEPPGGPVDLTSRRRYAAGGPVDGRPFYAAGGGVGGYDPDSPAGRAPLAEGFRRIGPPGAYMDIPANLKGKEADRYIEEEWKKMEREGARMGEDLKRQRAGQQAPGQAPAARPQRAPAPNATPAIPSMGPGGSEAQHGEVEAQNAARQRLVQRQGSYANGITQGDLDRARSDPSRYGPIFPAGGAAAAAAGAQRGATPPLPPKRPGADVSTTGSTRTIKESRNKDDDIRKDPKGTNPDELRVDVPPVGLPADIYAREEPNSLTPVFGSGTGAIPAPEEQGPPLPAAQVGPDPRMFPNRAHKPRPEEPTPEGETGVYSPPIEPRQSDDRGPFINRPEFQPRDPISQDVPYSPVLPQASAPGVRPQEVRRATAATAGPATGPGSLRLPSIRRGPDGRQIPLQGPTAGGADEPLTGRPPANVNPLARLPSAPGPANTGPPPSGASAGRTAGAPRRGTPIDEAPPPAAAGPNNQPPPPPGFRYAQNARGQITLVPIGNGLFHGGVVQRFQDGGMADDVYSATRAYETGVQRGELAAPTSPMPGGAIPAPGGAPAAGATAAPAAPPQEAAPAPRPRPEGDSGYYRKPSREEIAELNRVGLDEVQAMAQGRGADQQQAATPGPAIGPDPRQAAAANAYGSNTMAPTPAVMQEAYRAVDPEGKLSTEELQLKTMQDLHDFWVAQGKPEKAKTAAASVLLYGKKVASSTGAMALAAAEDGDVLRAAQWLSKGYAYIPNGESVRFEQNPKDPSKITYWRVGPDGERTQEPTTVGVEEIKDMAIAMANGSGWLQETVRATQGGGRRGKSAAEIAEERRYRESQQEERRTERKEDRELTREERRQEAEERRRYEREEYDRRHQQTREEKKEDAGAREDDKPILEARQAADAARDALDVLKTNPSPDDDEETITKKTAEATKAYNQAASRLYRVLPQKDRDLQIQRMGHNKFTLQGDEPAAPAAAPGAPAAGAPAAGAGASAEAPPVAGAQKAPDGKWYVKSPAGKWQPVIAQ